MDQSKKLAREQKKELKQQERSEKAEAKRQKEAEQVKKYGRQMLQEILNITVIQLYEKGYVRFTSGEFEKLLSVDIMADNLTKKSGLGRGVGALFTFGLNLVTPNTRGDVIVTILTDKKARTFEMIPDERSLKASQRVVQVANTILELNDASKKTGDSAGAFDLGEGLEKIVKLHKSGALNDAEFAKAKKKLLG
jgi:hypothetical protein